MAKKKFEDLNLKDAFLFGAAMTDPETCRLSMEIILGRKISDVRVHAEHTIFYNSDYRGVRLDVYAIDDTGESYDVEMQGEDKYDLPKRSRLYQAELDISALKPGEDFELLKPCYVIFICDFDPFGKGLYRYTFEHRCREPDFPLEECASKVDDASVKQLHKKVTELKKSREWRAQYMKLEELLRDREKEGRVAGVAEERNTWEALIIKMTEAGEADKLSQLSDAAFRAKMLKKYHL